MRFSYSQKYIGYKDLLTHLKYLLLKTRAIDINGLIGNIGGYIGLCLGYSILQIPEFVTLMVLKWRNRLSVYRMKNVVSEISVPASGKEANIQMANSSIQDRSKTDILNDIRFLKKEVNDINTKLDCLTRSMDILNQQLRNGQLIDIEI